MGFVSSRGAFAATQIQIVSGGGGGYPLKSMELRWVSRKRSNKSPNELNKLKSRIPVHISTKASDIILKAEELKELYSTCNHSCHRFTKVDHLGKVEEEEEEVDIHKLRIALSHSSILVSIFCNPHHLNLINTEKNQMQTVSMRNLLEQLMPVTPSNGQLVGFGRAVSDLGLTASIYDVMVIPSLRGMGIGRMIVKRIVRLLTSRDIYDISAVCSEKERLFFKACEFGDDILGSTTMMYARTVSTYSEGNQMV